MTSNPRTAYQMSSQRPKLFAVPHRISYLRQLLDALQQCGGTIFVTGGQVPEWCAAHSPAAAEARS